MAQVGPEEIAFGGVAGAPVTLTGAADFANATWIEVGNASQIQLLMEKTTANVPDDIFVAIQGTYDDGATIYPPTTIDQVAAGQEHRSTRIVRVTDFTAAEDNRDVLLEGIAQGGGGYKVRFGPYVLGGGLPDLVIKVRLIEAS